MGDDDNLNGIGILVSDHITAMLAYWDKNLICRFANAAYRDWFGKTREEMVGKITIKELLGPLYEKNLPFITAALQGKAQQFEREIPTPTGLRYSLANYFPDIVEGEVRGFFVHVADISKIKLLENELIKSNETIQRQNKLLLNFSNVVSHNLKSYANNLEVILSIFTKAENEAEKEEMFGHLLSISKGFTQTIKDLNEVVKSQNEGDVKFELLNVNDYVNKAIAILSVQIKTNKVIIDNKLTNEIMLMANPAYMESIFLNFLSNAIKYRHPERDPVIIIDYLKEDKNITIRIQDNGLGINLQRYGEKLFGMYKTFHGNADAQGIGLFITKYQVESMGGRIEVESEVGIGSMFSISFKA